MDKHEIVQRDRRSFDTDTYSAKVAAIDWEDFFESNNIDKINIMFEEKILSIMDKMVPIRISQRRKFFRNWLNDEVKNEMKRRDRLREIAKTFQENGGLE